MVLGSIARASNIKMLNLASQNLDRPDIQPNDVYDLATLVISELAYLHAHLPHTPPPQPVRLHGPILPSHVYQQVGGTPGSTAGIANAGAISSRMAPIDCSPKCEPEPHDHLLLHDPPI